jgi:hypothetical protein
MVDQMHVKKRIVSLFATLALNLLITIPIYAQMAGAMLSGTVTDPSGAIIPEAQVTIKNTATGVSVTKTTNASGFYTAPNLLPGSYEIAASAQGFSTQVRTGITLTVGAEQLLNLTMQVGGVTEKVVVTAEEPAVELTTSTLGNALYAGAVRELPLNGRDWTQLATLTPGVTSLGSLQPALSVGYNRGNRGFGTQLTISGNRPQQNNYRVDGIGVTDYSNNGPGSVLGGTLGVDAIQEFSVLTSNYTAEYGRTSGGVVNAISRSGTNQFHGDAYEFIRNSALDARNFFDQGGVPPFKRNQFGAAAGGPIRKDRTFFFGDYEGIRQSEGVTARNTVPSQDARNGILHNANGTTTVVTVDPLVKPFLPLWPLPNAGLLGTGDLGIFSFAAQQVTSENFATVRIDHKVSDRDRLFGSYQYDNALSNAPDSFNAVLIGNTTRRQLVSIEESHNFSPGLLNSFRVGYSRVAAVVSHSIKAINPLAGDPSLGVTPGAYAPLIGATGLTLFSGGLNSNNEYRFYWNSYQLHDDAFLSKGNHMLKFGVTVEQIRYNLLALLAGGGNFRFNSLVDLLTNKPLSLVAETPGLPFSPRGLRQAVFGSYLQDDIRWRSNFTINLGVRYEMSTVPTEVQGKLSNLRDPTAPKIQAGNPFFLNPTLRNFEPRVGFAWDPFRTGKTSVRAGFGIFDVLPLPYEFALMEIAQAPFVLQGSASPLPPGSFPYEALKLVAAPSRVRGAYIEFDPPRNYVMQWNLNVQRELLPNLTAMVAYVGSRGVHQPFRIDNMNDVRPTLTSQGYLWPCGGPIVNGLCTKLGTGIPLNPNFGRIDMLTWSTNSFFHALELQITRRMSHGFQIQGSYTWGKSIDEGSASNIGNPFSNTGSLLSFDRKLVRGPSDFNVTQNLVINYSWAIPTPRSMPNAAKWLLSGWQVGGIYQARTGVPFNPVVGGDPLGITSGASQVPNRVVGSGCKSGVNPGNVNTYIKLECFTFPNPSTLLGNTGRNSLTGPGLSNLDFSLYKNNYIRSLSDTFHMQFRVEVFNILNHANFQPPVSTALFDATGKSVAGAGLIVGTSTKPRQIQFALKVIW